MNCLWLFYFFNFDRNYDILKSESPCILLNKNMNLKKKKKKNGTKNGKSCSFREKNLVLQFIKNNNLKVKL